MKIPSKIRFLDEKIKNSFYDLESGNPSDKKLFVAINKALDNLELNAFSGIQIPKKVIPKEYVVKFNVKNLWKYNLPNGWRLIYSILGDEIVVVTLILEWFNHKDYEKKFNY
jgi:Txe/YoeB family toxin of Txe-Axe toxin-antitoxin module